MGLLSYLLEAKVTLQNGGVSLLATKFLHLFALIMTVVTIPMELTERMP